MIKSRINILLFVLSQLFVSVLSVDGEGAPAAKEGFDGKRAEIRATIEEWRRSWEEKDLDRFVGFYSSDSDVEGIRNRKRSIFEKVDWLRIDVTDVEIYPVREEAVAVFEQIYGSSIHSDRGLKFLHLREEGGGWKIVLEKWFPLTSGAAARGMKGEGGVYSSVTEGGGEPADAGSAARLESIEILEEAPGEKIVVTLTKEVNYLLSTEETGSGKLLKLTIYPVVDRTGGIVPSDSRYIGGISLSRSNKDSTVLTVTFTFIYNDIFALPPKKIENQLIIRLRKK